MKDYELKLVFDVEVGKIETTIFFTSFALSIEIFLSIYYGSYILVVNKTAPETFAFIKLIKIHLTEHEHRIFVSSFIA